jgi:hypothetical protein
MASKQHIDTYKEWRSDWNRFAKDVLRINLDKQQQEILDAISKERRVSVRSGTARGKDYVAAAASLCFLYLTPRFDNKGNLSESCKVVNTAPTGRQIRNIMIPEISKMFTQARVLPGRMLSDGIRFDEYKDWFLAGFKADENNVEAWSGLHSPNLMVVVTEASGISQLMFNSIEGILQGNSRLVLIFNPNTTMGEAYQSTKSPLYKKFKLSCLESINVVERKIVIPGQVDYDWVDEKIKKPGWVTQISELEKNPAKLDFDWNGTWYRPSNLFRVKVLGEFPEEAEDILIPLSWVEMAMERWTEAKASPNFTHIPELDLGVDVAGMGTDNTVFGYRYGNYLERMDTLSGVGSKDATIHMQIAGRIKNDISRGGFAYIDTIGEGAGVYSRLIEQEVFNAISCKFSEGGGGLTDMTGERKFVNMRAYLYWMVREALDPAGELRLMIPPSCGQLLEELPEINYKVTSTGAIQIEAKEDIRKRLGRSIDYADTLANTFYPKNRVFSKGKKVYSTKDQLGVF